jgi:hypothetical protein
MSVEKINISDSRVGTLARHSLSGSCCSEHSSRCSAGVGFRLPSGVLAVVYAVVVVAAMQADVAQATTIVNLQPYPQSDGFPAFLYTSGGLVGGTGSHSSGDGGLSPNMQLPGGLQIQTPFNLLPGTAPGEQNNADGSTTFFDATLAITNLTPTGSAVEVMPFPSVPGTDYQQLKTSTSSFSITSTGTGIPLLTGTFTSGLLSGTDGSHSANVFTDVTYTGGAIYNAMLANNFLTTGEATFNLQLINSTVGIENMQNVTPFILPFMANGQVLFNSVPVTVPEPTTMALFAAGALGLLAVGRRRRASL